jgi:hypothetical protein
MKLALLKNSRKSLAQEASRWLTQRLGRVALLLMLAAFMPSHANAHTPPGMPLVAHNARVAPMFKLNLPGQVPKTIPQNETDLDFAGKISSYQPGGPTTTSTNAFFSTGITTNGRTCFTCHQPQNAWSITPSNVLTEFLLSLGKNALFQPIDAASCPDAAGATSKSLFAFLAARQQLFNHANFRISLNAPNPLGPSDATFTTFNGNTTPQWIMTVKSDPTHCELDPQYGLPNNLASVYRRPLAATNQLMDNPGNGPLPGFNEMWDAREPNLTQQFIDATEFHGQATVPPTPEELTEGVTFQQGIYTAQSYDNLALDLTGGDGSGALGGPLNLYSLRLEPDINESQFITAPALGGCAITGRTFASLSDVPSWAPGTSYSTNSFVLDSNGNLEVASTGGTSGTVEPTWPVTIATDTDDGTVIWVLAEVGGVCPALHPKETITTNQVTNPPLPPTSNVDVGFDLYGPPGPATFTTNGLTTRRLTARAIAQRQSIVRGEAIFNERQFTITNVTGLNDAVGINPRPGQTCSTCHNNTNAASDAFFTPKHSGIGDNSLPVCSATVTSNCTTLPPTSDFPLFAFYCPTGTITYFSNPVNSPNCAKLPGSPSTCDEFDTTDPGVGLITGNCADLGKMKVPVLRGLAARAPYFHGGEAATLQDLVAFYNARFSIGLSKQDQQDLVNFLNSL